LHEQTGLRPNTVGEDVAKLVQLGILRECQLQYKSTGRPSVPLEIDPSGYNVLGVSIQPNQVGVAQLNLRGQLLGDADTRPVADPERVGELARNLLSPRLNHQTLAVGVTTTGKYDAARRVLHGSWLPGWKEISLEPLYQATGNRPVLLKNDMAALTTRWLLQTRPAFKEHVLLVSLEDGNVGGSLLACQDILQPVIFTNELGHTRLFVDTDPCYCGHTGCLTQLCSSRYLRRLEASAPALSQAAAIYDGTQGATRQLIDYVGAAVGNIANTVFVDRIVLVSSLLQHLRFAQALIQRIRAELLFLDHGRRVTIDMWNEPVARPAETASWQALVGLYVTGWSEPTNADIARDATMER
jgi:predicted NBD/HSP70 family sugar kinase